MLWTEIASVHCFGILCKMAQEILAFALIVLYSHKYKKLSIFTAEVFFYQLCVLIIC